MGKLERAAAILRNADVRDPRAALDELARIINEKKVKVPAPAQEANDALNAMLREMLDGVSTVLIPHILAHGDDPVCVVKIYNDPTSDGPLKVRVTFESCDLHIEQRHVQAAIMTLKAFDEERCEE